MRTVLLFGPPLSGKHTLLKGCADAHQVQEERARIPCGADGIPHWVHRVTLNRLGTELVTVPGAPWRMDVWWPLLAAATGVALVLDGQEARERADREHIDALMNMTMPATRCVIFTKEDLIAKGAVGRVSSSLLDDHRISGWHTFRTRSDQPATLVEPIEWLVRHISSRS